VKVEVATGIEELKRQFVDASFIVRDDGQGGAYVVIERVSLGPGYRPDTTWMGFQIPALYPYADIYPVFIGSDVCRTTGADFVAPVTRGHSFEGRSAIQVSRRNGAAQTAPQKAVTKILKVMKFLESI
jgi:hypothetical protein